MLGNIIPYISVLYCTTVGKQVLFILWPLVSSSKRTKHIFSLESVDLLTYLLTEPVLEVLADLKINKK